MFDYTQQPFWRGPWYPYWSLIIISIFGGLFGLDHFWLRSPLTGVLKMIVNIFGLGIWCTRGGLGLEKLQANPVCSSQ